MDFDFEATFGEDYLYFYAESTDDGHSDDDAAEIIGRLELPAGARVLDAPCGLGRIARRLAAAGLRRDRGRLLGAVHRHGPGRARRRRAGGSPTSEGDLRRLPVPGPFDAVVCWFTSFGYHDDDECRQILAEFHRVLRPGGTVLIETMHHDGVVRHYTAAPDATVLWRGDDAQVDLSRFDPLTGRIATDRTVYRDGAIRRSSHFIRLPTPPEWTQWLEGGRLPRRPLLGRRGRPARARQLGDGGRGHGLVPR